MDIQMPEMDGYEASRCIRDLPNELGQVPILALTAALPPMSKLRNAGMNDFLLKPFTREALFTKTDQMIYGDS
jgi:CheY-like chemotaxis protein